MRYNVISREQALAAGLTRSTIDANIKARRWQRLYRGTYVTHNGPVSRLDRLVAVLAAAGPSAALSHQTAAELAGLSDRRAPIIHVTVPANRRISRLNDARIHYSQHVDVRRHPTREPTQIRVEETAFDLAGLATSAEDAVGWLVAACARRLTTANRLAEALVLRKRIRWRRELSAALADVSLGVQSILEMRYLRKVERAHGLPTGIRQVRRDRPGGSIYDDVHYPAFGTVIELDGRATHSAETMLRDGRRDNIAGLRGDVVLHFGWSDVSERPCATALQVAAVLKARGWMAGPRRCGPSCDMIRKGLTALPDRLR
ncbi:MAG TPA: hypothetical protein VGJ28_10620 [Micromonosporaceae bacterium]